MPRDEPESVADQVSTSAGAGDVEMTEEPAASEQGQDGEGAPSHRGETEPVEEVKEEQDHQSFVTYLASPMVTLVIGEGQEQTLLTAHQALLAKSPYFEAACQGFVDDGSPRQVELLDEDTRAVGSFLEFLYTGEYFPRKIPGQRVLEEDKSMPKVDDTGVHLLRHARIYSLARKFQVPELKKLSGSKIHCIDSTAKGEIVYARYVYAHTTDDDARVRAPIASFWASRSHSLRAEAEEEFKALCLEHPQFGYDVLTRVLDDKLKRERGDKLHPATSSGRKRSRHNSGGT